jgi:hypothetical protein
VIDLATQAESTIHGARASDLTGFALATANLNGDQARDVVIGAFGAAGPNGDRPAAGAVYVILGSSERVETVDPATGEPDITVHGAAGADRLGEDVAAGDVSGDGLDDLILPAPFAAGKTGVDLAGRTYVIHSPAPPLVDLATDGVDAIIFGVDDGDQLGHVTSGGDVDGDGLADILVTAVSADGPGNTVDLAGEAVLVYATKLTAEVDVSAGGADVLIYGADEADRLGRSAVLGDLDGDGRAELVVGAPGAAGADAGAFSGGLYVLPSTDLPSSVALPALARVHYGSDAGDSLASEIFGRPPLAVAGLREGASAQIIVAAPTADGPEDSRPDSGEVYVLFPAY